MLGLLNLKKEMIESSATELSHHKGVATTVVLATHTHTPTNTFLTSVIDGMRGQPHVPATLPPGK